MTGSISSIQRVRRLNPFLPTPTARRLAASFIRQICHFFPTLNLSKNPLFSPLGQPFRAVVLGCCLLTSARNHWLDFRMQLGWHQPAQDREQLGSSNWL